MVKKAFFFLWSAAMVFSCKQEKEVEPIPDSLTGTVWVRHYFDYPGGQKLYKVLQFKNDGKVKINFLFDMNDIYVEIGEMKYNRQDQSIWIINQDLTRLDGYIFPDRIELHGEIFERQK